MRGPSGMACFGPRESSELNLQHTLATTECSLVFAGQRKGNDEQRDPDAENRIAADRPDGVGAAIACDE